MRGLGVIAVVVAVLLAGAGTGTSAPSSAADRQVRRIVVIGQEQDVAGFNVALACCTDPWAGSQLGPAIRGAFVVDGKLHHVLDLASAAKATSTTLSYTIRPGAYWYWGGRKLPVTYRDFVYTWQQLTSAQNDVASRDGYGLITGWSHDGPRQVTFSWRRPYGDWRDLFRVVYPSAALAGADFAAAWTSCICGADGEPVADGPFYLAAYTRGQGATYRPNPYWYGRPPALRELDFRIVSPGQEVTAMQKGYLDLISPTVVPSLGALETTPGIRYSERPGLTQEHVDLQLGPHGQPLLRAPWLRRAIMLALDRGTIAQVVYGPAAGGTTALDSLLFYPGEPGYRRDFARWSFAPARALALLERHCRGGPSSVSGGNTATWTCAGLPARFRLAWSDARPAEQAAIIEAELKAVGIDVVDEPLPESALLGPAGVVAGDYDLASYAWTTPRPDPSSFAPIWSCGGQSNYVHYCNRRVSALLAAADRELDPPTRLRELQAADRLLAADVPTIPLYAWPCLLVYRSTLQGPVNNPSSSGFTWNIQDWRWGR